ncbi:Cysteine synthase [Carex littledalei]|uniref:Cysteine synthase n=1 Tax=Carex littledalei TaxID=544730 RepID=A0A833R183_9POAL|nr:Cysteine synthase [Carex littledalei]
MEDGRRGVPSLLACTGEHIASNMSELIGWTPLVELKKITQKVGLDARLVAKLEFYQPLSSVKDRSALRMIEDAEEKGLIKPGVTTLAEPTGGNLGIGIILVAIQKGYRFIAVMPAQYSLDKQILLQWLGAEVQLIDPTKGIDGLIERTEELKKQIPNVHVLDQFTNLANPDAHFRWTGPEIWEDTAGKIDIFVAGSGSGGTVTGVGKYLKTKNPNIKIVCVEPAESPVISGGEPGPHIIQGLGPGLIPENLDTSVIDEVVTVSSEEAMANARRLAVEEGVLGGISSGAALAASLKLAAKEENKGKMIVMVLPSGGERDTGGKIDILVAGSGSGGTVSGAGKYLKMKNPNVKIVCVEPAESPVISDAVESFRGQRGLHKIQGVGPGFIPTNLDMSVIDEVLTVTSNEAMANARRLAVEEGLLVGISSGAALAASLKVASRVENKGKMIVMVFPSGGERYTNSALFAQVREECINMTF